MRLDFPKKEERKKYKFYYIMISWLYYIINHLPNMLKIYDKNYYYIKKY